MDHDAKNATTENRQEPEELDLFRSPSWDDAVECGCEKEWEDMYRWINNG